MAKSKSFLGLPTFKLDVKVLAEENEKLRKELSTAQAENARLRGLLGDVVAIAGKA